MLQMLFGHRTKFGGMYIKQNLVRQQKHILVGQKLNLVQNVLIILFYLILGGYLSQILILKNINAFWPSPQTIKLQIFTGSGGRDLSGQIPD